MLVMVGWLCVGGALAATGIGILRNYLRQRGPRVVTCPETGVPVGVSVNAGRAALTAAWRRPDFRLDSCSRWPERRSCGQECLRQIATAPDGCLLRGTLAAWYEGKECAYCRRPMGHIDWALEKAALLSPARKTVSWDEVAAEQVQETLRTHQPVCWTCHVTNTFVREHPGLITDRSGIA